MAMVSAAEASLAEFNVNSLPVLNFAIIDDLDASLAPVMATVLQAHLANSYICTFSGRSDVVTSRLISRAADIAVTASIPADIHKFHIQELYREQFVLVTARSKYRPSDDWRVALSQLPFVQYSDAMPVGQLVATHLKRIGLDVPRRFSFETSRSVIATVAHAGGWTLATPLSILDASRFRQKVDIYPVPFTGLSRPIYLINRMNELGVIPDILAGQFRTLLKNELFPEFARTAPNVASALEVHEGA